MGEEAFISDYAMESPGEDFAETAMWFMRSWKRGLKEDVNYKLARKWRFMKGIVRYLK